MGFSPKFIPGITLPLPVIPESQRHTLAPLIAKPNAFELRYTHFSVVMQQYRRLAWYAATNIDGRRWKAAVKERQTFVKDDRLQASHQTGDELYDSHVNKANNDFDKGHIAKFQDPQWGNSNSVILKAAEDSMYYTNCLPQHHSLNRGAWKSLEDYIVKKFTLKDGMDGQKIAVFAGPVLADDDPYYMHFIEDRPYQIPCHFWKVIVYRNLSDQPTVVGFIMSQKKILKKKGFIVSHKKDIEKESSDVETATVDFFTDFTKGEPYQVRIDFIEQVTGLRFSLEDIQQPYTKKAAQEIIFKRTEVETKEIAVLNDSDYGEMPLDYTFLNIILDVAPL
jgi:endonuclease G, mitochondrial